MVWSIKRPKRINSTTRALLLSSSTGSSSRRKVKMIRMTIKTPTRRTSPTTSWHTRISYLTAWRKNFCIGVNTKRSTKSAKASRALSTSWIPTSCSRSCARIPGKSQVTWTEICKRLPTARELSKTPPFTPTQSTCTARAKLMGTEPPVTLPIWWLVIWQKLWAFLTLRASSLMPTPPLSFAHERGLSDRVPPTSPSTRANTPTDSVKGSLPSLKKWINLSIGSQALLIRVTIAGQRHSSWSPRPTTTPTNRRRLRIEMMKRVPIDTSRTTARISALLHSS